MILRQELKGHTLADIPDDTYIRWVTKRGVSTAYLVDIPDDQDWEVHQVELQYIY